MIHEFDKSNEYGTAGEEIVIDYLQRLSSTLKVTDVSNKPDYQSKGIDLVLKKKSGEFVLFEVKTDSYTSGNIYYETVSNARYNTLGGFEKTQADFILYYFEKWRILLILGRSALQDWFSLNKEKLVAAGHEKRIKNRAKDGSVYESIGYTIPIRLLMKHDFIKVVKFDNIVANACS